MRMRKIAVSNAGLNLKWILPLLGLFLGTLPAGAKTITVTSTNDAGTGSLRQAINTAANNDTINFNLPLPATITLNSPLTIGTNITISGPGATSGGTATSGPPPLVQLPLVISGGGAVQDFIINAGANVEITGLSIAGGNAGSGNGGAISNAGELVLINVVLFGNTAAWGGGIFNTGKLFVFDSAVGGNQANKVFTGNDLNDFTRLDRARGGAIYNQGEDPSLPAFVSLTNTSIISNKAGYQVTEASGSTTFETNGDGSGIYNDQGTMALTNCMVWQNEGDYGTGIFNSVGATLTLSGTSIYANIGFAGAGIYNNGSLTATNSTFYQNHAYWFGGGLYQFLGYQKIPGSSTLVNSTIAHNEADGFGGLIGGGGIFGGYVTFKNTVIAEHGIYANCAEINSAAQGINFSDDPTCPLIQSSDQPSGLDPAGLKDNGGPAWTVALVSDSPLIDSIPDYLCTDAAGNRLRIDQRGVPRPQGSGCDIGAFELLKPSTVLGNPVVVVQLYGLDETVRVAPLPTIPQVGLNILLQATLDAVNHSDDKVATGELNLFIGSVNFLVRVGVIDKNLGAELTIPAQAIFQNLSTGGGSTLQ